MDVQGESPLHFTAFYGYSEVTQILLKYEAKTDMFNKHKLSPLHYAAAGSYSHIINHLFIANSKLKQANDLNYSVLHITAAVGNN
ncbi:MAG: ankyrin repeat domain-containing protein [Candidatus Midichloria sp.]|nr:ankyrin repeat domain-containing protein [Candidatus Midichloria sp.]